MKDEKLSKNKSAVEGIDEMKLLLQYCELFGIKEKVKRKLNRQCWAHRAL